MQEINTDNFHNSLKAGLKSSYLIVGDEPLQKFEAIDKLKSMAKLQDYEINQDIQVGANFDWRLVEEVFNSASLFHKKQFLHLEFGDKKIDKKSLNQLIGLMPTIEKSGDLILLNLNKLDKTTKKTKWFSELFVNGILLQIWQIDENRLPNWIMQRSKKYNFKLSFDAARFLAKMSFGNLLAVAGELEKLSYIVEDANIEIDEAYLVQIAYNSSCYNIFDLSNYLVARDLNKVWQVLEYLKLAGEEEILVLWSFVRQIRILYNMKLDMLKGESFNQICKKHRIWRNQHLYGQILQNTNISKLEFTLTKAYQLDLELKSSNKEVFWERLLDLNRFLIK